jgi:hypothetical protein
MIQYLCQVGYGVGAAFFEIFYYDGLNILIMVCLFRFDYFIIFKAMMFTIIPHR